MYYHWRFYPLKNNDNAQPTRPQRITISISVRGVQRRFETSPTASLWPLVWQSLQERGIQSTKVEMTVVVGRWQFASAVVDLMCQSPGVTVGELGIKDGAVVRLRNIRESNAEPFWPQRSSSMEEAVVELDDEELGTVDRAATPQSDDGGDIFDEESVMDRDNTSPPETHEQVEAADVQTSESASNSTTTSTPADEDDSYKLRIKRNAWYHCDFVNCSYKTSSWAMLSIHTTTTHNNVRCYCCPHPGCNLVFYKVNIYEEHTKTVHNGDRLPRVELSDEELERRKAFTNMMKTRLMLTKRPYKRRSLTSESQASSSPSSSPASQRQSEPKEQSKKHTNEQITATQPKRLQLGPITNSALIQCDKCPSQFLTEPELYTHRQIEHEGRKRLWYCPMCRYIVQKPDKPIVYYDSYEKLEAHIDGDHGSLDEQLHRLYLSASQRDVVWADEVL